MCASRRTTRVPLTRHGRGLSDLYARLRRRRRAAARLSPALSLRRRRPCGSAATRTASCPRSATSICTSSTRARTAQLWKKLGAHLRTVDGVRGTSFAVWAPNARRVSVVGDFCGWDGRMFPMRMLGSSGVWELFVPDVAPGALYKFEILTREGVDPPQDRSVRARRWSSPRGPRRSCQRDERVSVGRRRMADARAAARPRCDRRWRSTRCISARGRASRRTAIGRSPIARSRRGSPST